MTDAQILQVIRQLGGATVSGDWVMRFGRAVALAAATPAPSQDREDALRYRQLREHHHINDAGDGWLFFRFGCGEEYGTMSKTQREAALDAAVDAARQAPKEPT